MTDIDYAARVAKGIALLDVKWPEWATEIDLDRLDIQNGTNCMTAQYAQRSDSGNNWVIGKRMLDLNTETYEGHGFRTSDEDEATMYPALNGLWKAEIERRRTAATPEASER